MVRRDCEGSALQDVPEVADGEGKPRHPQSQGSVNALTSRSMFNRTSRRKFLKTMITEEDLLGAYSFSSDSTRPDETPEFTNPPDGSPECSAPPNDSPKDFPQQDGSSESSAPPNDSPEDFAQPEGSAYPVSPTCGQNPQGRLHQLQEGIALQRSRVSAGQLAQAERMVKRSRLENIPGDPGDNMTIPIPLVDRGKGDPRNVAGVILDRNENDMYRIGVRDGILKVRYSSSQFDICSHQLNSIDEVSADKEIGLRQAVQQSSRFGGQGYAKCNCTACKNSVKQIAMNVTKKVKSAIVGATLV
ncbi:uncharacterized protein [Palaemon carinicauda]|uniref:uncharacterized protein n=1 Tax=Palaemon carinicauda TaxID=392227 RepID=UPI0035B5EA6C